MSKKVVLAVEGFKPLSESFDYALQMALRLEAELTILVVIETGGSGGRESSKSPPGDRQEVVEDGRLWSQLQAVGIEAMKAGVPITTSVTRGKFDQQIMELEYLANGAVMVITDEEARKEKSPLRIFSLEKLREKLDCPLVTVRPRAAGMTA